MKRVETALEDTDFNNFEKVCLEQDISMRKKMPKSIHECLYYKTSTSATHLKCVCGSMIFSPQGYAYYNYYAVR